MTLHGTPGFSGIMAIVVAMIAVSVLMTLLLGMYAHWPIIALGIIVGLWAVQSINK